MTDSPGHYRRQLPNNVFLYLYQVTRITQDLIQIRLNSILILSHSLLNDYLFNIVRSSTQIYFSFHHVSSFLSILETIQTSSIFVNRYVTGILISYFNILTALFKRSRHKTIYLEYHVVLFTCLSLTGGILIVI